MPVRLNGTMGGEIFAIESRAPNVYLSEAQKATLGNNKERWCTPPEIFQPQMEEFNFDLDAAADIHTKRWTLDRFSANSLGEDDWEGNYILNSLEEES
jgi:hypothetical protein